jgi:hypothetical protein
MDMASCEPDSLTMSADGCSTTVSELSSCLGASVEQFESVFSGISCDSLSDPAVAAELLGMSAGDPTSLPECAPVAEDCPGLFASSGGSGGEPAADGCDDTCISAGDSECDDGGPDADWDICALGTDCADCGPR